MENKKKLHRWNRGFTLLELLISISIIAVLTSIAIGEYSIAQGKARDAKRLADIKQVERGLVQYYAANGTYPEEKYYPAPGTYPEEGNLAGWEVSYFSDSTHPYFLEDIQQYLGNGRVPLDPINSVNSSIDMFFTPRPLDGSFFYNYYFYNFPNAGTYYGCSWTGDFAVLGIRALEKTDTSKLPKARCGPQPCAGGGTPNVCRDWSTEFDYSIFLVP